MYDMPERPYTHLFRASQTPLRRRADADELK